MLTAVTVTTPARGAPAAPYDRVHITDGPPHEGRVHTLIRDAAGNVYLTVETLDGKFVLLRRENVVAIEFEADESRKLPENADAGKDLIVRRDGTRVSAPVMFIGPNDVLVEGARLDRDEVGTIVFRPRARVAEPDAVQPCPDDKPLGGWITLAFESSLPNICKRQVEAAAWFPLVHWNFLDFPRPPWPMILEHMEANQLSYEIRLGDCDDLPGDDYTCTAPGGEHAGVAPMGSGTKVAHTGQLHFFPPRPALRISFPRDAKYSTQYHCVSPGGSGGGPHGVRLSKVKIGPNRPDLLKAAPVVDLLARVDPAPCDRSNPDRPRDCVQRPDKYAVIPFAGAATVRPNLPYVDEKVPEVALRYEICCGCGKKPSFPGG